MKSDAVVFLGPTLPVGTANAILQARCHPPAERGVIIRAVLDHEPRAIGIVDGYFEAVPAVSHKEILWAMARGVHVFGGASMGALRAAELHAFGMEGVGRIFAAYRDGAIEDDDEVAVSHGPAETGYLALSDAMIDIRATVDRARRGGVVAVAVAERFLAIAKGQFFKDRSFAALIEMAAVEMPAAAADFRAWLPTGRVEAKRDDAIALLEMMRDRLETGLPPKRVSFTFHASDPWRMIWRETTGREYRPETDGPPRP